MKNICDYRTYLIFAFILCYAGCFHALAQETNSFPVNISIASSTEKGALRNIWRFFGCDEPNYATMKDGQKLLSQLGELRKGDVYFRTHNLLNTGDGTPALKWGSTNIYTEDANGNPIYNWTIVDNIFDSYIQRGVRPYLQIGFMPQALSTNPDPYRHEWRPGLPYDLICTGWAYPPKDYNKWAELIYQWTLHCIERYGREEVEQWYFQVWNEANSASYWRGTHEEFCKLHDYAIDAVRRALPKARVGGPDVAGSGGKFMDDFMQHLIKGTNHATGKTGTPVDFLAFHAKGSPSYVNGHVRMGISTQLSEVNRGFAKIAAVPELKNTPIVIGESDPEGCAACQGPQNNYRNGTMYSSYTAASFARKHDLADRHGINFDGALTWAFEFEDQPYFAGFRALASNGIEMPVLNVFRMFSKMSGNRVAVTSSAEIPLDTIIRRGVRKTPDVSAFASRDGKKICVMVWHYHDDDVPGPDAQVNLNITGLGNSTAANCTHYRIDQTHSNAYAAWLKMGSPIAPNSKQYDELLRVCALTELNAPEKLLINKSEATMSFELPRQAVSFLVLDLE
jgi:Glycosyl hydrolases family 39.